MLNSFQRKIMLAVTVSVIACQVQAADDLTLPIRVSDDGRFLVQPDGQPFFWLADTAWNIFHRLDRTEADLYLKNRAGKGFTVIQAVALCELDCLTTPNRYGELPLIEQDVARPNPRYFAHIDWVIGKAHQYGLRVALLPAWGRRTVSGVPPLFTADKAERYGQWIAERYRDKGILWILGGDVNPLWAKDEFGKDYTVVDYRPIYDAMAKGILAGSGGNAFITYHLTPVAYSGTAPPRTSLYFDDRAWLDMNMIQSGHANSEWLQGARKYGWIMYWQPELNYEPVAAEFGSSPTRPIIDGENCYEEIPKNFDQAAGYWDDVDTRRGAYQAVFAGAAGHTFGNNAVWQFFDPARTKPVLAPKRSWLESLDLPGAGQMKHIKALVLSRPYFSRIPDQSALQGDLGIGSAHVAATRDQNGSYIMVYTPHGQPITVRLSSLSGSSIVGWWFDPRTGAATKIARRFANSGSEAFEPPSAGRGQDWVLVLDDESKRYPAPGSEHWSNATP